jgi:hypothetical protein
MCTRSGLTNQITALRPSPAVYEPDQKDDERPRMQRRKPTTMLMIPVAERFVGSAMAWKILRKSCAGARDINAAVTNPAKPINGNTRIVPSKIKWGLVGTSRKTKCWSMGWANVQSAHRRYDTFCSIGRFQADDAVARPPRELAADVDRYFDYVDAPRSGCAGRTGRPRRRRCGDRRGNRRGHVRVGHR